MLARQVRQRAIRPSTALSRQPEVLSSLQIRRNATAEAGENKSGHISVTSNEGILFFQSLIPINFQWLNRCAASPHKVVQDAVKNSKLGLGNVEVLEVLPRLKEGGAFVKFRHDEATDSASVAEAVRQHLKAKRIRPFWNPFTRVRAGLVLGRPWVEDLFRMPSRRLKVEFLPSQPGAEAAELTQEQLYSFFRPYGKLADIVPQASDSKVLPRHAYVDFARVGRAILAKNCLHGYGVSEAQGGGKLGTVFRLSYEKKQRYGWIKDWLFGHPRIVIPALAALIAEDNAIFKWFKTQGEDLINKVRLLGQAVDAGEPGMQVVWDDRKGEIEQIRSWLMETADTFII
ncbi:hypothetical protein KC343_g14991, partial [Hortaea werneckii]